MTNSIFDKTDKGREEIATRKYQLQSRLRTLLVLIDGKQTTVDLLTKVAGLGLSGDSITELQDNGFIQTVIAAVPADVTHKTVPAVPDTPHRPVDAILPEGQNQFQAIYQFYTETIKSTIGLRGYALQLKVEKASSIEEFRELRQPYLEAVLKSKGNEIARSLRNRLDQLLYIGESSSPTTMIGGNVASSE
jgi:hypothetical protein